MSGIEISKDGSVCAVTKKSSSHKKNEKISDKAISHKSKSPRNSSDHEKRSQNLLISKAIEDLCDKDSMSRWSSANKSHSSN